MAGSPLVVCIGDALVDLIAAVERLPPRAGAVWSPPLRRLPGGTGANVAVGLAALGIRAAFIGAVGDDVDGQFLVSDLEQYQLDLRGLRRVTGATTGSVVALVQPDGERTFVACATGGAHAQISDDALAIIDELAPAAVFVTGLLLLEDPSRSAVRRLTERLQGRTRLYFDPNLRQPSADSAHAVAEAMLAVATVSDVVIAGESETRTLGLLPLAGQLYVIKRGAHGARLQNLTQTFADVAAHPTRAIDATGAGDVFDAAFIAAHTRGYTVERALRFANAAAALSVTQRGARTMPSWDAAERLASTAEDKQS